MAGQLPAEKIRRLEDELAAAQVEITNLNYALADDYVSKEKIREALREPCDNCKNESQRQSLRRAGWGIAARSVRGSRENPWVSVEEVLERLGMLEPTNEE